jgi:hypothetical protein
MGKWTKEPWEFNEVDGTIYTPEGYALPRTDANQKRASDCVNACAGVTRLGDVKGLVEVLRKLVNHYTFNTCPELGEEARAALSAFALEGD